MRPADLMRRAELLRAAEMTQTTYTALSNRGLLPFSQTVGPSSRSGWGEFSYEHALKLGLVQELARAGMPQAKASSLVRDQFDFLMDFANSFQRRRQTPFIFGALTVSRANGGETGEDDCPVMAELDRLSDGVSAALNRIQADATPLSLLIINATDRMARIYRQARQAKRITKELRELAGLMRVPL